MINTQLPMDCQTCKKHLGSNPIECEHCFEYINIVRLLNTGPQELTNSESDLNWTRKWVIDVQQSMIKRIHEMDNIEELFKYMKMTEFVAAGASLMYNARVIKERVPDVDKAEKAADFKSAVREQRIAQLPKKEKRMLTDREKAIEAVMKMGMSEVDAIAYVEKNMSVAGRLVKVD